MGDSGSIFGIPGDEVADNVEELFEDCPPPISVICGEAGGEGTFEAPGIELRRGVRFL